MSNDYAPESRKIIKLAKWLNEHDRPFATVNEIQAEFEYGGSVFDLVAQIDTIEIEDVGDEKVVYLSGSDSGRQAIEEMVIAVFEANEPVSTKEIAEYIDKSGQSVRNHLSRLKSDPRVNHKMIGQASVLWPVGVFEDDSSQISSRNENDQVAGGGC